MSNIIEKAKEYVSWDPNEETRNQIQVLIDSNDISSLEKLLLSRMAFGTAGLRGPMGPGYNKMNELVILQTTQGLIKHVLAEIGETAKLNGVVIGYDHRRYGTISSLSIARITAAVFLSQGFKVYLLENFVPTPFVAFGVTFLKASCGIMVTASHNPKQDNGFKLYWNNGCQIIPPHDEKIANEIKCNLQPWQIYDTLNVLNHENAIQITDIVANGYYQTLLSLTDHQMTNRASPLKVAYTAMHGVGTQWILKGFEVFNHKAPILVTQQTEPNPDFPTVSFPNPEEKGALNIAIEIAKEQNCQLIVANDPDADRLAAAEKLVNEDNYYVFTGNEIGYILGHWSIMRYKNSQLIFNENEKTNAEIANEYETEDFVETVTETVVETDTKTDTINETAIEKPIKTPVVLASVVSSRMLKMIALKENIDYYDTLTGFKWLGNRSVDLKTNHNCEILFAYEEALGYAIGSNIFDKDGISAGSVLVELTNTLYQNLDSSLPNTLYGYLQYLYNLYGKYISYNSYLLCYDVNIINKIFHRLRTNSIDNNYMKIFDSIDSNIKVISIKDITLGYDSTTKDLQSDLPKTPDSHMIMYEFSNHCTLILRTSGTEPKIKYYTEMVGNSNEETHEIYNKLKIFVDLIIEDMLQPIENNLTRPK